MFLDRATIEVRAGKGGDGVISFHRAKYVPRGGPDGGNGGNGGSVILRAVKNLNSLDRIAQRRVYSAEDGRPGQGQKCHGRNGKSIKINVPIGTIVRRTSGKLIADLTEPGQELVVAQGGIGGKGNVHFASATRQVPRIAERGTEGQKLKLDLELKLIAQVGLVGLPNAGKSTFLKATTRATPAVGAYPFTTLTPYLGVARLDDSKEVVIADIPGLIEGASEGVGLGDEFLKHVERNRILLHLVEATAGPDWGSPTPLEAYTTITNELRKYKKELAEKPTILALNKIDAVPEEEQQRLKSELEEATGKRVFLISGATGAGTKDLLYTLYKVVKKVEQEEAAKSPTPPPEPVIPPHKLEEQDSAEPDSDE